MNNVKIYREKRKKSLKSISRDIEVSERHLRFVENGERMPSLPLAKKIADCLNVTIEELFFNEV